MKAEELETKRKRITAPCDIVEEDGKIKITLDMPGVTRENLTVHIENDELQITGKRDNPGDKKAKHLVKEIPDADFYQAYTVDQTIDREKIEAVLSKGQLHLTLSIRESEKPRKIQVTSRE